MTGMERVRDEVLAWLRSAARLLAAAATSMVALVLLLAFGIGLVLVPVFGLGLPVVAGALGAIRMFADRHRLEAGSIRGTVLGRVYVSEPAAHPRALLACLRDPQTWRDAVWLAVHFLFGQAVIWAVGAMLVEVVPAILVSGGDVITNIVLAVPLLLVAAILWWSVPWLVRGFAVLARAFLGTPPGSAALRIAELTESRAATVDAQASELRRIERDLHDGAQARLAAVGMTLGLASQALRTDTRRAGELLEEARADAGRALAELRDLVRGIHPPVLADRGLAGGLEAAALLCPVPVHVHVELSGRPEAPVESALYFATAEALANVGRHSGATTVRLRASHDGRVLRVLVADDGHGGADPRRGTGLRGIERRLSAFDGALHLSSPPGGPTELTMELPCALSLPRTTSSSATA